MEHIIGLCNKPRINKYSIFKFLTIMKNFKLMFAKSLFLMAVVFMSASCQNEDIKPSEPSNLVNPKSRIMPECHMTELTESYGQEYEAGTTAEFRYNSRSSVQSVLWYVDGNMTIINGQGTSQITIQFHNNYTGGQIRGNGLVSSFELACDVLLIINLKPEEPEVCSSVPEIELVRVNTIPEAGYPYAANTLCMGGEVDFRVRAVNREDEIPFYQNYYLGKPSSIEWSTNMPNNAHWLSQNSTYLTLNSFETSSAIGYWNLSVKLTYPDGCVITKSISQNIVDCGDNNCSGCP